MNPPQKALLTAAWEGWGPEARDARPPGEWAYLERLLSGHRHVQRAGWDGA